MAATPAYDLMVLIDADVPEDRRSAILESIKRQISSGEGELKGDADWGVRKLAYEINHRTEAYYHLFQLEAVSELLQQLEHSLSIEDAVLRHRFIRLPKGAPETTPRAPSSRPFESEGRDGRGEREHRGRGPESRERSPEAPQPEAGTAETVGTSEPAEGGEGVEQPGGEAPSPQPASG